MARIRLAAGFAAVAVSAALLPTVVGAQSSPAPGPGLPAAVNGVAPGPEVLHRPPADAPQLENTGVWEADPTMVCLTSAYRKGEFLYQDCVYDDNGGGPAYRWYFYTFAKAYRYPTAEAYRQNAADILEVRIKPLEDATAIRVTYNTMTDAGLAAATIALGDGAAADVPHGANTRMPAQVFVTAHGRGGDIVDAATGRELPFKPTVATDVARRQVEVRVPYSAFDPRGRQAVRVAAAAGLWDNAKGQYLLPRMGDPTATEPGGARRDKPSAFFNVAFRYDEPIEAWRDHQQLAAVEKGDLSPFFATVDFTKLAAGADDDMAGQRGGIPAKGYMNMLFASHFESAQGRRLPSDPNGPRPGAQTQQNGPTPIEPGGERPHFAFGWPCRDGCVPDLPGRIQRYLLYVPEAAAPAEGYGAMLWLGGYALTGNDQHQGEGDLFHAVGERADHPTLVAAVDGRGNDEWFYGESGSSIFETWADVARRFPLDGRRSTIGGFSSGAYGANKLALQFPDVWGKAFICDGLDVAPSFPGLNGVADNLPADTLTVHEEGSRVSDLLPSRYNQPVMEWAGLPNDFIPYNITRKRADIYAAGDYDYEFISWTGLAQEHLTMCNNGTWPVLTGWLGSSERAVDPARVVYVRNPFMDDPRSGLVGDRAYWVSAISARERALGTVDVTSSGLGAGPRRVDEPTRSVESAPSRGETKGTGYTGEDIQVSSPVNPFLREVRHPAAGPARPAADRLAIKARNIGALTIDPQRAKVTCRAALEVDSDGPLSVTLLGCGSPRQFS